jgi:UDP-N-acetylmuramoyl-L-alanyl-D-glutamate--2,6-diaminopimelate ligase
MMMTSADYPQCTLGDLLAEPCRHEYSELPVKGVELDSRKIRPGEVFIALPGERADGREYIGAAIQAGAVAVLVEDRGEEDTARLQHQFPAAIVPVKNLREKAGDIAACFWGNPSLSQQVVAVTGTNGKTTCAHLVARLYQRLGCESGVIGTLGWGKPDSLRELLNTTPDAVACHQMLAELLDQGVSNVAMEVSSHGIAQHRVSGIYFDTAVFTNLSRDHLDYHQDMASYEAAKFALFWHPELRRRVINLDDESGRKLIRKLQADGKSCVTYSISGVAADVSVSDCSFDANGVSALVKTPWGNGRLESRLLGEFNLANLLAAIAVLGAQGISVEKILPVVPALQPVRGRMEIVSSGTGPLTVVDYAHTPDALENALQAVRRHCKGKLWCVFGCGGDRDKGKRALMGKVASDFADEVLVTSDNPRSEEPAAIIADILAGAGEDHVVAVEDRKGAIERAIAQAGSEDCVLIAGKGHEQYQRVGDQSLPFDDAAQARLALNKRAVLESD